MKGKSINKQLITKFKQAIDIISKLNDDLDSKSLCTNILWDIFLREFPSHVKERLVDMESIGVSPRWVVDPSGGKSDVWSTFEIVYVELSDEEILEPPTRKWSDVKAITVWLVEMANQENLRGFLGAYAKEFDHMDLEQSYPT